MLDYASFLASKVRVAAAQGFAVEDGDINPALKDFVRVIVRWAARGGRRGVFSSFGLHKTSTQIELARLCARKTGARPLIVLPLGVRQEFFDEAQIRFVGDYAVELKFIRSSSEIIAASSSSQRVSPEASPMTGSVRDDAAKEKPPTIYLTNYESAREGKIDASLFDFVSLDEAAVLRGFGGAKTFREFMRLFADVRYRYVATATPSPNEYIELLAYAAFLDVMDVGQAKTRFFKRNSEKADQLVVHPHKEREFWLWVASWALFVRRPSDLGFSDDGYVLPEIDLRWHEVESDHRAAGAERDGQMRLLRNAAIGVQDAAREKRDSLPARIEKMMAIRAEDPLAHRIIWHDLEAERRAIEAAIPSVRSIFGAQDLSVNEQHAIDFKHGRFAELATKPEMSGAGCNFQAHCHWAIFLGIGFKFHDFIQAVHRLVRFGQTRRVRIDLIYSEAERDIRERLERRWRQHDEQAAIMSGIIRDYGLAEAAIAASLTRSIGVARAEITGEFYRLINNDCVEETAAMASDSIDLIVTSIPFSTQYEYTPSYNDFGHSDDDAQFWAQMDFLVPQLYRVLKPGRVAAIHVKDRIVPGGLSGFGFQTVSPFSDDCTASFRKAGFAFLARKTIVTDVVRENNQTYRLGWSEQCKDGSRMGAGLPEYLLLFRKPPSDRSNGYADTPVVKDKPLVFVEGSDGATQGFVRGKRPVPGAGYSRGRWQLDAHGFLISDGDRLLLPSELAALIALGRANPDDKAPIYRGWKRYSESHPYHYETHVAFAEELDRFGLLPPDFMLIPPHSQHPDVWTDITRMRTLNAMQYAKGREMHLCPLQFDLVDRVIRQFSMPGENVLDPFGGLMTVPYRALLMGRRGVGIELSADYFRDGAAYVAAAAHKAATPSLFDLLEAERESAESPPLAPEDAA